jgi:reductive dehalogenase
MAVDDAVYSRFDGHNDGFALFESHFGQQGAKRLHDEKMRVARKHFEEGTPGYRIEDRALADAGWAVTDTGGMNEGLRSWNRLHVRRPEDWGTGRWEGEPGEAAALVKAAARHFGAATVGIAPLDRRHISWRYRGSEIAFENVEEPTSRDGTMVIPEKVTHAVALSVRMSLDAIQCSPTAIGSAGTALGYSRCEMLVGCLAEFIRGLGYTAIPSVNDLGSSVAIAVDAGLGELGRTNRLVTPEHGPNVRLAKVLTDLPMAVDGPVSFGLREFCRVCKRCAKACPGQCISHKDDPDFEVLGPWNNPGHEAWFDDAMKCLEFWNTSSCDCTTCIAVCPWSKKDRTAIHSIVKASGARIPALDGLFTGMDEAFGYGRQRDPDDWWRSDLPEYGIGGGR